MNYTPAGNLQHWLNQAEAIQDQTVALRRAIHQEPELGLQLPKTTAKIKQAIKDLPLELREGPSTSGVVAILKGAKPGPSVLLRGDMDALPMPEDTDLEFKSREEGRMHACGHDSHAAMLASAAKLLSARQDDLAGSIYFMFQPGEEGHFGARYMLDDGLLDPIPDAAFALHIMPNGEKGKFYCREGAMLASADVFNITVTGRGGHASMPHDTVDPVPIACEIVTAIQAMVTRRINAFNPAVVTVTKITSGTTNNVIPESADLLGTIRTVSPETRAYVKEQMKTIATHIAQAHGATATLSIEEGYPVTINDGKVVRFVERLVDDTFGSGTYVAMPSPVMGAEDFSYVLQKTPGAMAFIGAAPDGCDWKTACPCHSNKMVMSEDIMAQGVALHCAFAERFLKQGGEI